MSRSEKICATHPKDTEEDGAPPKRVAQDAADIGSVGGMSVLDSSPTKRERANAGCLLAKKRYVNKYAFGKPAKGYPYACCVLDGVQSSRSKFIRLFSGSGEVYLFVRRGE